MAKKKPTKKEVKEPQGRKELVKLLETVTSTREARDKAEHDIEVLEESLVQNEALLRDLMVEIGLRTVVFGDIRYYVVQDGMGHEKIDGPVIPRLKKEKP